MEFVQAVSSLSVVSFCDDIHWAKLLLINYSSLTNSKTEQIKNDFEKNLLCSNADDVNTIIPHLIDCYCYT